MDRHDLVEVSNEKTELNNTNAANESLHGDMQVDQVGKDISAEEDLLGAQSLLYSDSEEEDDEPEKSVTQTTEKKVTKISPKRNKRIVDSDEEELNHADEMATNNEKTPAAAELNSLTEEDGIKEKTKRKKISALIDSESEDDDSNAKPDQQQENEKLSKHIDSDSSVENENKVHSLKKKYTKKISTIDSESENDTQSEDKDNRIKMSKMSALVDSESDEDIDDDDDKDNNKVQSDAMDSNDEVVQNDETNMNNKKKKPMRASAKKALDEMQAIQSEQQRLHREAHITIPYHKPKRHTLQEFLKRRTIVKPQLENIGSPGMAKSLRMNTDELEQYAKLMEERAKEATEFFKSESSSEEEELKDNEGVLDMERTEIANFEPTIEKSAMLVTTETPVTEPKFTNEMNELMQKYSDDMPSTSKAIVTEVIELPKLDINSVHILPELTMPISTPTSNKSDNLKRLIAEKQLSDSPTLKGDSNMLIDLETGDLIAKKPSGADNLLQRLLLTNKARKSKTNETLNILSTENGKLEISKVNISITEDTDPNKEQKPGAAYLKLKENLKSIIKQKRLEDLQKKQDEENEYNKCLNDDDEEEDDEYEPESKPKKQEDIVIDEEENAIEDSDAETEADDNEEIDEDKEEIDENKKEDVDKELDENMETDEIENDEGDSDDALESIESGKRKNRIIKFQDDSDDEIDFLKTQTQAPTMLAPTPATTSALYEPECKKTNSDEENELLGLCSGKFDETQKPELPAISQIPTTHIVAAGHDDTSELLELCSGTFEDGTTQQTQAPKTQQPQPTATQQTQASRSNKILSSDEENISNIANENGTDVQKRNKKFTKKLKKKKAKLGFSDDEEDDKNVSDVEAEDEVEEEVAETFVDYDSEENEIVVKMTKDECRKKAANYLENEAELSESEWGSADEDEKNLDKYEIELGDEDEFDREKLQTELGQIHARKMLDEDIREVRKIQEMLFEDEEKDGVGRQRQFKWKNAENGFSLDDSRREDGGDNGGGSGDDESEQLWRKIRYEREQLLKEQGLKNSQDMTTTITNANSSTLSSAILANSTITAGTVKKLNIITAKKTSSVEVKKGSPFLISKVSATTTLQKKTAVRGSFLVRDKETLIKLAGLTKGNSGINNMDGTAGTVSVKTIKAKNFVFATLTEEEHETQKRKADDLMNSSTENGINYMKKPKMEPRRDKCMIDQLL